MKEKDCREIFEQLGASDLECQELIEYTKNKFNIIQNVPEYVNDEPFVEEWKEVISKIKQVGVLAAINQQFVHEDDAISLEAPESVKVEIYNSIAGNIPVIYAKNDNDFYELVQMLVYRRRGIKNIEKIGASFVFNKTNKFIVLSYKPYSNIPAASIGLRDEEWRKLSVIIRREHECMHYFTKRFLGSSENNIHDELVADFSGIYFATGTYHSDWFLKGMGIDKYPEPQLERRYTMYTLTMSNGAKEILKKIVVKVSNNVEQWARLSTTKEMTRSERTLFLCGQGLMDLYMMWPQ